VYPKTNKLLKIDNIILQSGLNTNDIIPSDTWGPNRREVVKQEPGIKFEKDISVFINGKSSIQRIDKNRNTVFFNTGSSIKKIVRNKKTVIICGAYSEITICNNNKAVIRIKYKEEVKSKILIITLKNDKIYFITIYSNKILDDSILDIFKQNIFEQ
jgi:hypothetical protein